MKYDVFISHASEDKKEVVLPLANFLKEHGLNVWVDVLVLQLGDSLRKNIERGLKESRFGVVILSPNFFSRPWTQRELDVLVSREDDNDKVILPILHNISFQEVRDRVPLLADKLAVSTNQGLEYVASQIINVITNDAQRANPGTFKSIVVGISGPSCSGKTWLAQKISKVRQDKVTVFDLDSYYKDVSFVSSLEHRHDNPNSINYDQAIAHLAVLKNGREVSIPTYDFETHQVNGEKLCKPNSLIIVEGIFVFYNEWLKEQLDLKVWVSSPDDICLDRRISRDGLERGRTTEEVLTRYKKDVRPGYQKYISPLQIHADVVFQNTGSNYDEQPKIIDMIIGYVNMKFPFDKKV